MLRWLFAWTVVSFVAAPSALWADEVDPTRTAARHLALEGSDLFASGDYDGARDRFRRAYDVYAAPTLASWHARALQELGRWVEAEEWYIVAASWQLDADASPAFHSAVQEAELALQHLRAQIPKIRLVMRGNLQPNAQVRLDDREVPGPLMGVHQPVDPGPHRAEVWIDAQLVNRVDVRVGVAEQRDVILDVSLTRPEQTSASAATPSPTSSSADLETSPSDAGDISTLDWRLPVVAGLGVVGVAGLTLGVWQGLEAASQHRQLEQELCVDDACPAAELGQFRRARTRSTVGYLVGTGALLGGAAVYWFSRDVEDSTSAAVTPWVGWASAGVKGRF